jgi:hypothetical protein
MSQALHRMKATSHLVTLLLLLSLQAFGHALHQSTAEAEYNPQTKKLEVSLRVFASDLELALIRHSEQMISLDKTPAKELDPVIQAYLASVFILKTADGKPTPIEWVGKQTEPASRPGDDDAVTLFFEIPLPAGLQGYELQHTVLCECYQDQVNLLRLRDGVKQRELRFTRESVVRKLNSEAKR